MVNGKIEKPSLMKDTLLGWANLIFAEVLCMIVNLFTAKIMSNIFWRGIIGFCTMAILVCIIGNHAYNRAKCDKAGERTLGAEHQPHKHIIASILIGLPLVLEWIALLLVKVSHLSIGNTVYVIYRLVNAYFLPWINIFCLEPNLEKLSYMGLISIFAFTLIPMLTFGIVYVITYNNIDIEKIIVYNRE
ncbi:MAG: hypothetical protein ACI4WH_08825 [Oscillospiraceae bacterium]